MKRAVVLIKPLPHYRRDSFVTGLQRLGFTVVRRIDRPEPGDVLVTWNLTGSVETEAQRFTRAGADVIVVENGYFSPPSYPTQFYAISKGGHCGAGRFPSPYKSGRWQELAVQCKPWVTNGRHILVVGQRGIGSRAMASPHAWHQKVADKLRTVTSRPVNIRAHPGQAGRGRPLAEDMRGAHLVVIWSSTVGVRALIEGIPVLYAAPHWICWGAAMRLTQPHDIEQVLVDDDARLEALEHMANGQWLPEEIATGEPLLGVLEC